MRTLESTPYESAASKLVASLISELRLEVQVVKQRQTDMEAKLEQAIKLMAEAQEMIVSQEQFIAYLGRQLKREGRAEERDRQKARTIPKVSSQCRFEVQEELTLEGTIDGHAVRIFGHLKTEMRVCLSCRRMIERAKAVRNKKQYIPCRWSNQQRKGHIHTFPAELATIYESLKATEEATGAGVPAS